MKRVVGLSAILLIGVAFMAQPAQGAIATSFLRPVEVNTLEDLDYESFVNIAGGAGTIDVGDILYGIWQIQSLIYEDSTTANLGPPWDTFTMAFGIRAKTVTTDPGPPGGTYDLAVTVIDWEPLTDAQWDTYVRDDTGNDWTQLDRTDSGTMLMVFSDPDGIDATSGADEQDAMGTVDGTELWELGFSGVGEAAAGNEFWRSVSNDASLSPVFLHYGAALSVTDYASGPGLLNHDTLSGNLGNQVWKHESGRAEELQIEGKGGTHATGNFAVPTETDVLLKPIPEPVSVLIWGALVAMGLVVTAVGRRRMAA